MPELATAWVTLAVSAQGMRRDIRRELNGVDGDARQAGQRAGREFGREAGRTAGQNFGREFRIALGAIGVGSIPAAATALTTLAGSLQQVTQAGLVVPGVIAGVMSSVATVKLGVAGVADAFKAVSDAAGGSAEDVKKADEALKKLAPSAREAVKAGVELKDQLTKALQLPVQQNLFRGLADDARKTVNDLQPVFQRGLGGISNGLNQNARQLLSTLGSDSGRGILDRILGNTAEAQSRLTFAIDPLVRAFGTLAAAGSDTLPRLAGGFGRLADRFNAFTTGADADGRLNRWIDEGITGVGHLGDAVLGLMKAFTGVTQAAGGGAGLLAMLDRGANALAAFTNSAQGQQTLIRFFAEGRSQMQLWAPVLQSLPGLFSSIYEISKQFTGAILPPLGVIAELLSEHAGLVQTAAAAWLLFRTAPALMGRLTPAFTPVNNGLTTMRQAIATTAASARAGLTAIAGDFRNIGNAAPQLSAASRAMTALTNNSSTVRSMSNAFIGASSATSGFTSALRIFATTAGGSVVSSIGNGLRSAVSGVVGALGGPFSAALIAAGAAFSVISSKNQAAENSLTAYQDAVRKTAADQAALNEALTKSRGAFDDTVKSAAAARIGDIGNELQKASERTGTFFDMFRDENRNLQFNPSLALDSLFNYQGNGANYDQQIQKQADAAKSTMQVIDDLKMSNQSLTDVAYGSQAAFDALVGKMEAAGDSGKAAAGKFRDARVEFLRQQEVASRIAPGVNEMASAMRTLADNTATAADKTNALKTAMDALNPARSAGDAEAAHTQAVAAATSETPIDTTAGVGGELFKAGGAVNTLVANGVELNQTLKNLADTTASVGQTGGDMATVLQQNDEIFAQLAKRYQADVPAIKAAYDTLGGSIADASGKLGNIAKLFQDGAIPTDRAINVSTPGGQAVYDLMVALNQQVRVDDDKNIAVDAPLGPEVLQLLKNIGYEVTNNNGKLIVVDADTAQADTKMRQFIDTWSKAIVSPTVVVPGQTTGPPTNPLDVIAGRSAGAIVAMADGGMRQIRKPTAADIYAGRGAGTVFAEEETGGEAYIPLATGKRRRSTAILAEVARRFGLGLTAMADGGITVDALKQFASAISGRPYNWGAGDGDTFDTDCSGAQSTVANFITGAGGRFSTQGQAAALLSRGFQAGDPPQGIQAYWVGWRNGGPGGGHTAGTILDPEGGNVNVEMGGKSGGGQFGGSAAGASDFPNRAWIALASGDDPNQGSGGGSAAVKSAQASVTSSRAGVTTAQNSVDKAQSQIDTLKAEGASQEKIDAAEKRKSAAEQRLTAAQERQDAAETRLSEVKDKEATKTVNGGDNGGQDFGRSLMSGLFGGLMESIGLPGFANLLESPNFKSGKALFNAFAGPLKGAVDGKLGIQQPGWMPGMPIDTGDGSTTTVSPPGGGALPGIGMPGVGDFLKPLPGGPTTPLPNGAHGGTGAAPGPGGPPNISYQMTGVDPKVGLRKADAHANQAYRSSGLRAVRPV